MKKPRTIREIIKAAGGATKVAEAVSAAHAGKISADAVYQWPKIGIPDRYWSTIMPMANATPAQMFKANEAARAEKAAA